MPRMKVQGLLAALSAYYAILAVLIAVEGTAAETWYVSPTAIAGNNGTNTAEPFTLVEGLAAAQGAGGEVNLIFLGSFDLQNISVPLGLSAPANLNLTIQSSAPSTPVAFSCSASASPFLWAISGISALIFQDVVVTGCPGFLEATDVGQVVLSGVSVSGTVTPTTVTGNFTGLFITGSSFTGNTNKNHSLNGGAIMATVASLTVSASSFVNNSARAGHGIFAVASAYATQFVISSSTFETNRGLVSNDGGSLVIDSTIFSAPAAFSVVLDNLLVLRNTNGNYDIAGVYLNLLNHNATVTRSLFQGQNSGHGVGGLTVVATPGSLVTVESSAFLQNQGRSTGAASITCDRLEVSGCLFQANGAGQGGGSAVLDITTNSGFIRDCSIKQNGAVQYGTAAITIYQGTFDISGSDISFNKCFGVSAWDNVDLTVSYSTIWNNSGPGLQCNVATNINASTAVSVHGNGQKNSTLQFPEPFIEEVVCVAGCASLTLPDIANGCTACKSINDVCTVCQGNNTLLQDCFPPDPQRQSVFVLPLATTALARPPLGQTGTTFAPLVNGTQALNSSLVLQLVTLRQRYFDNDTVIEYPLNNGEVTQGVPVVTTASDGSPVLYFEYRMLLPNGATVFLLQTVVASLFQQTGPGIPSFLVASNNLKLSWELYNWPLPATGPIDLEVAIILSEPVTSIQNSIAGSPNANVSFIDGVTLNTQNISYTVSIVTFYAEGNMFDNTTKLPVHYHMVPANITTNWTVGTNVQTLTFTLPNVSSIAVLYDPDFGVVLQGSSDTSSSSSGSGDNLLPLLSLIALVIPLAFVLLAIVILSIMGVKAWKYRQHQSQIKHSVQL